MVEQPFWKGISGQYKTLIEWCDKPLILNVQHDWEFVDPARVLILALANLMMQGKIGIVRFHKRSLPQPKKYVDRQYYELIPDQYHDVPLISTDGWGDSPHIATLTHYKNKVLPNLSDDYQRDYGRYGVEGPVWRQYQKDIKAKGFAAAWCDWLSCIYGRFGDGKYVRHLGGDATNWRKELVGGTGGRNP